MGTLEVAGERTHGDAIMEGSMHCAAGHQFPVQRGIPDLTWPTDLAPVDQQTRESYDRLAWEYEKFASIPFRTFHTDEDALRARIADGLHLQPGSHVLEIGCGDGRGSAHIARRLGPQGRLYLQDLSPGFLALAIERVGTPSVPVSYAVANASFLPFPDRVFDAAHHFGGLNTFADIPRFFTEICRVVKPGGRVIVGDEGMAPWLRGTDFGRIMMNSNPLLRCEVPFAALPVTARDVTVEWIMMGAFYLISFTVGESEPVADYHIPIPSERGGTHWTRYHGNLEGVTDEVKALAKAARERSGLSMHDWLNRVITEAAQRELKGH